ncbi:MAG TPA: type II secretion system F family protein [Tepidisphaeraceae bacterium]|nr:type II secretion system F family protein [Tepidisphaeraceae bacterium]
MNFSYTAYDKSGAAASGSLEAATLADAREKLRRQGLYPTEIRAGHSAAGGDRTIRPTGSRPPGAGQRLRNLAMFSRQMQVLLSSGTPIVQALGAIERQCEQPAWRAVVAQLRQKVEEGSPLSEAMRHQPAYFDDVCRSLVTAGESSGTLPLMLERLASLTRKQLHLRNTIVGALVYPCVLIGLGLLVLVVMLLFVLPRFAGLFESLDSPLPPTTRMLMWTSHMLWNWWWACGIGLVILAVTMRLWLRSEPGRRALHTLPLNLPKLGRLSRSIMSARMARMLGTLLDSKVPLLDALQLTRQSAVNLHYAELLARAEAAVGRGEPVSAVLGASDLVSACVQEALRNGEASGQVAQPLLQMADFLDEENDVVVRSLTSIIEPAILIALGLIVGFIALSMFLPLFDLVSAAHGGGGG